MRQILELVGFIEDCCPSCVLIPKDHIQASSIEQGHVQILCILFHSFLSDRYFAAVEKSGEHWEHAPGTPKVSPRNTQGNQLSKRCVDSISSHIFAENSLFINIFLLIPVA